MMVDRINGFARRVPTWVVYVLYMVPAPYFFYLAATGQMGVEPVEALEHEYGEIALQLLIIGLAITPLRRFVGVNFLKFRRAVGLCAFFYVVMHLGVWAFLDVQSLDRVWADVVKRPYITIGMLAFAVMVPLAVTSNNRSVRVLGPTWRTLHKATYAAAILGAVHYIMLAKGFQLEPVLYLGVIVVLLGLRMIPKAHAPRRAPAV